MAQALPLILMAASMATSVGTAAYQSSQEKSAASKARRRQRGMTLLEHDIWKKTAYPTLAEKQSAAGELGRARLGSYQNLATNLAARGFGPGSGLAGEMAGRIESGYGKAYSDMLAQMSRPKWPAPSITGGPYYMGAGPGAAGAGAASDWLNQAAGYYWMSKMLQGGGGGSNPYMGMWGMPFLGM